MKKANQRGSAAAVILGPDEIKAGTCMVKNLKTGEQTSVALSALSETLQKILVN